MLECGQQIARRLLKDLENMSYEEQLRDLGLLIVKKMRLRWPLSLSTSPWKKVFGASLFCCTCIPWTRGNGLEVREGMFRLEIRKIFFTVRVVRH